MEPANTPQGNASGPKVLVCSLDQYDEFLQADSDIYLRHYRHVESVILPGLAGLLMALQERYDIVHLLCSLSSGGVLRDQTEASLLGTDLITKCRDNGVKLLWIASENKVDDYIRGFRADPKSVNLVMTINRNGARFPGFLEQFLSGVSSGEMLPSAWARLAPQVAGASQRELPTCIFVAGMPDAILNR